MSTMEIPAERWYAAIEKRRSRRRYAKEPLTTKQAKQLYQLCDNFKPFECTRAVFINKPPDKILKGLIGTYGKIRGAPAYFVLIGDTRDPLLQEQAGYFGEGIVLEVESMEMNTCWVCGLFKPEAIKSFVKIKDNEVIIGIITVGIAIKKFSFEEQVLNAFGFTHKRKHLSELTIGLKQRDWPEWMKDALNAARLAPSALNRQPWRFHVQKDSITIATDKGETKRDAIMSKRLDCGIAMLHIEVTAMSHNIKGYWEFHDPPLVARFTTES